MARPRKYKVSLTDEELKNLKAIIRKKNTSKTVCSRCQILIDLDENHEKSLTHKQIAKSNGICMATITNTIKAYVDGGIDSLIRLKRNINSNQARQIVDGRTESKIIEMACNKVPEGHSRWTLRLLEEQARIVLETPVSREAIRRALKKTNFDLKKCPLAYPITSYDAEYPGIPKGS